MSKSTHSSFNDEVSCPNAHTASTTTLLFTVRMIFELAASSRPLLGPSCHCLSLCVNTELLLPCLLLSTLSSVQMTCLTVDIVTIFLLRQANSAVLFPLILIISTQFYWNCIIGLAAASDSLCAFKEPGLCGCLIQYKLCVVYSVDVLHRVGTHPENIREMFWRLNALARS